MKILMYKLILTAFINIVLFSCANKEKPVEEAAHHEEEEGSVELTADQFRTAGIEFGKVEMKSLRNSISVNGVLDVPPQNMVSVSAMMGGFIKSTELLQGLVVKKGQVIATIQNPEFIQLQSTYLEQKEKLVYLQQEYKRQEELSQANVAASKIFQQVSAEYQASKSAIIALEARLRLMNINTSTLNNSNMRSVVNIYAPISGHVTEVNVNIGKYVNPQDVICEIVDTDHLHAELTVFEKDVLKIKKGQKVRFVLVNESNQERMASVFLINREIAQDRTVRVHAHLDKEDASLLPNMYLKAQIETGEGLPSTALPEQAVVNVGEKFYIFIKDDGHGHKHVGGEHNEPEATPEKEGEKHEEEQAFRAIEVGKGIVQGGYIEVLLPKDFETDHAEVVTKGAYALLAKMNNGEEGHAH